MSASQANNSRSPTENEIASGFGTLYARNSDTNEFDTVWQKCEVVLTKANPGDKPMYASTFAIHVGDRCKLSVVVLPELQMHFDRTNHSLVWPGKIHEQMQVLSFKFNPDDEEEKNGRLPQGGAEHYACERQFKLAYAVAFFENSSQADFSKAIQSEMDRRWVHDAFESNMEIHDDHQDMDDLDFGNDCTDASEGFLNAISEDGASHNSSGKFMKAVNNPLPRSALQRLRSTEDVNNILSTAITRNRAFVVRGSKIGVFNVDEDGGMEYVGKLPVIEDESGNAIAPSQALLHGGDSKMLLLRSSYKREMVDVDLETGKALLHGGDSKMLLLRSSDKREMVDVDLETGKVVSEFRVRDEKKVDSIAEMRKYNQGTDEQVFMGLNKNSMFTMDPRINNKNKQVADLTYKIDSDFRCSAATGDGYVAVGSGNGAIRLYKGIGNCKRATTLLPGLGAPITSIDVTEDSSWILITTERFLLCVPTHAPDLKTGGLKNGFTSDLKNDIKPIPFKLQLKPEDVVKYNIDNVEFTSAKFNIGQNIEEQWIVTSTGPYLITWNFRKVKQGIRDEYKIKMADDTVMADQFRYNLDDQVVVALPDRVQLHARHMRVKARS